MSLEDEYRALRYGSALSRMDHVGLVRLQGDEAIDAVDAVCSGDLWVRDGRMLQTLVLDEKGQRLLARFRPGELISDRAGHTEQASRTAAVRGTTASVH